MRLPPCTTVVMLAAASINAVLLVACAPGAPSSGRATPSVGVTTLHLVDEPRGRRLETEVWYPAPPSSSERPELYLRIFVGHTARNAAVMPGPPRPLVVMSHGSGSFRQDLAWLAEDLVRQGFIVAASTHPLNNYGDDHPQRKLQLWERPQDVSAMLSQILAHPGWRTRVDGERVGAAGFSLGGYTVLQLAGARYDVTRARAHCVTHPDDPVCASTKGVDRSKIDYRPSGLSYRDVRIKAVMAFAPAGAPATDPASLSDVTAPIRVFSARADSTLLHPYYGGTWETLLPGKVTVLDGPDHASFVTRCLPGAWLLPIAACSDPAGVDRKRLHQQLSEAAVAFFTEQLGPPALN